MANIVMQVGFFLEPICCVIELPKDNNEAVTVKDEKPKKVYKTLKVRRSFDRHRSPKGS